MKDFCEKLTFHYTLQLAEEKFYIYILQKMSVRNNATNEIYGIRSSIVVRRAFSRFLWLNRVSILKGTVGSRTARD